MNQHAASHRRIDEIADDPGGRQSPTSASTRTPMADQRSGGMAAPGSC